MAGNECTWIQPATRVGAITGADERRGELAHFKMQMRQISTIGRANRRDLLAPLHFLTRLHQHRFHVAIVRLHIFPLAVLGVSVKDDDHVPPPRPFLSRQQDAAIRDRIDWIAEVAILATDPI